MSQQMITETGSRIDAPLEDVMVAVGLALEAWAQRPQLHTEEGPRGGLGMREDQALEFGLRGLLMIYQALDTAGLILRADPDA